MLSQELPNEHSVTTHTMERFIPCRSTHDGVWGASSASMMKLSWIPLGCPWSRNSNFIFSMIFLIFPVQHGGCPVPKISLPEVFLYPNMATLGPKSLILARPAPRTYMKRWVTPLASDNRRGVGFEQKSSGIILGSYLHFYHLSGRQSLRKDVALLIRVSSCTILVCWYQFLLSISHFIMG